MRPGVGLRPQDLSASDSAERVHAEGWGVVGFFEARLRQASLESSRTKKCEDQGDKVADVHTAGLAMCVCI